MRLVFLDKEIFVKYRFLFPLFLLVTWNLQSYQVYYSIFMTLREVSVIFQTSREVAEIVRNHRGDS